MANYAEEPLTTISLNLFTKDLNELKQMHPRGWTTEIRWILRRYLNQNRKEDEADGQ